MNVFVLGTENGRDITGIRARLAAGAFALGSFDVVDIEGENVFGRRVSEQVDFG